MLQSIPKIVSLIGARGGSQGIKNKNIIDVGGQPLISYPILDSLRCSYIEETYVSTDCEEIASIAKEFGANVPFIRPKEYASDTATDYDYFKHFISWFYITYDEYPLYIIHLRPTTPIRNKEYLENAIEKIIAYPHSTSLRSVEELNECSYKMFKLGQEGLYLEGLYEDYKGIKDYSNLPRQQFPKEYKPNGYIDIIKPKCMLESSSLHGNKILSYITPKSIEIDTKEDLEYLRFTMSSK
jgi:CMP-N-acetylneuraminic acid synthetase